MDFLPELEELKPITNDNVFGECYFDINFNNLSFEKKLKVLCDIVRQSVYPNGFPNPDTDILKMNGNCYTAAHCFVEYAKHLNIGQNQRCALVRKRIFDPDNITTIHVVALVDSSTGETYQVDATPFVGYKYGSVENITLKKIYEDCVVIDNDIEQYLYQFRKIIYEDSVNRLSLAKIDEILELCQVVHEIPILKGYAALVLKIAYKYLENKYDKDKIQILINTIKPCNRENEQCINEVRTKLQAQTAIWMEELRDLKQNNRDLKRQQELASVIVHENKWLDDSYERYIYIGGKKIRLSSINPRFFLENGYETLVTSKLFHQLEKSDFVLFEYDLDLKQPTEQLGLETIMFFRASEEQINYRNIKVSLVKKGLMDKLVLPDAFKTKNFSDDSIKLLIGYPEHQVMTRFMYPNPRLVKMKK